MKKWKLVDSYEGWDVLGYFDHLNSVKKVCRERDLDTDGEWSPILYKWDEKRQQYYIYEDWSY